MTANEQETKQQGKILYEQYGKRLEAEHWGEYIAISPDGQIVLGNDLMEVAEKALSAFGRGSFLFKIGERAVWKWR